MVFLHPAQRNLVEGQFNGPVRVSGSAGTGKTIVALMAMLLAIDNGFQACLMAPTEILATQHYQGIAELAQHLSVKNKLISGEDDAKFLGEDNEWLVQYAKRKLEEQHYDYFIFGHRHLPLDIQLNEKSKYINLGDWIKHYTYGKYNGLKLELKPYEEE